MHQSRTNLPPVKPGDPITASLFNAVISAVKSTVTPQGRLIGQDGVTRTDADGGVWYPCLSFDDVPPFSIVTVFDVNFPAEDAPYLLVKIGSSGGQIFAGNEHDELIAGTYGWVKLIQPSYPVLVRSSGTLGFLSHCKSNLGVAVSDASGPLISLSRQQVATGERILVISDATAIGNFGDASRLCSPWHCISGSSLSGCTACPTGATKWVANFGSGARCGGTEDCLEMFAEIVLEFRAPGSPVPAGVCVWEGPEFLCDGETYLWVLVLYSAPWLHLFKASDWPSPAITAPGTYAIASFLHRHPNVLFCCTCDNVLEFICPPYLPPICEDGPTKVCLKPQFGCIGCEVEVFEITIPDGMNVLWVGPSGNGIGDPVYLWKEVLTGGTYLADFQPSVDFPCRWVYTFSGTISNYPNPGDTTNYIGHLYLYYDEASLSWYIDADYGQTLAPGTPVPTNVASDTYAVPATQFHCDAPTTGWTWFSGSLASETYDLPTTDPL